MQFSLRIPASHARYVLRELRAMQRAVDEDVRQRAGDLLYAALPPLVPANEIEAVEGECYVVLTDAVSVASKAPPRRSA